MLCNREILCHTLVSASSDCLTAFSGALIMLIFAFLPLAFEFLQ